MKFLTKIVAVEWKEHDRFKSHQEVECEQYSCNMHFLMTISQFYLTLFKAQGRTNRSELPVVHLISTGYSLFQIQDTSLLITYHLSL